MVHVLWSRDPAKGFVEVWFDGEIVVKGSRDPETDLARALLAELAGVPGLRSIQPAGSFRRRRETIGDLDLLAETDRPAGRYPQGSRCNSAPECSWRGRT